MKTVTKEDFDSICRLCLMQGPMASIFDLNYEESSFPEVLLELFSTKVTLEDEMPKNICETCISEIVRFYSFRKVSLASEKILRTILTKELTKTTDRSVLNNEEIVTDVNNSTLYDDLVEELIEIKEEPIIKEICESNSLDEDKIKIANITVETVEDISIDRVDNENLQEECTLETENSDSVMQHLGNGVKKLTVPQVSIIPPLIFICSCKETFTLESELIKHKKEEKHLSPPAPKIHMKESNKCELCQKVLSSKAGLRAHLSRHGDKKFLCSYCGMSFQKNFCLQNHMRRHTGAKPYSCKFCDRKFTGSSSLLRHTKIHTGAKPYKCKICSRAFTEHPHLKSHLRLHTGEKPYTCRHCSKSFRHISTLRRHMNTHTNEKIISHQCKICEKFFSSGASLNTHLLLHGGEKKFLCSYCGMKFYSNGALHTHSKVHTGAKPHSCTLCDRSFSLKSGLKTHMLIHTGDKPYKCKICSKAFTQRPHLTYHLRTHSGERPYVCTFCDKKFSHSGTLRVHVRTHTGETPYMCDLCPRGFYDSSSLKRHRKRHSGITGVKENEVEN